MMTRLQRWTYSVLLLICAILALVPFEGEIGKQLTDMLTVTLSVYAVARGINAIISTAQGTELSIEPAGVGVTFTPGEILDPLNDLIEQVSTVLLIASASIGIQKIVLGISDIQTFRWILTGLSLIGIISFAVKNIPESVQKFLIKVVLILTILRCVVPVMTVFSNHVQNWLETDRQKAVTVLMDTQNNIETLNKTDNKERNFWGKIKESLDIDASLNAIKHKAEQAIEASIYLLSEFVLVFILMPITLFFVSIYAIRRLFN